MRRASANICCRVGAAVGSGALLLIHGGRSPMANTSPESSHSSAYGRGVSTCWCMAKVCSAGRCRCRCVSTGWRNQCRPQLVFEVSYPSGSGLLPRDTSSVAGLIDLWRTAPQSTLASAPVDSVGTPLCITPQERPQTRRRLHVFMVTVVYYDIYRSRPMALYSIPVTAGDVIHVLHNYVYVHGIH